MLARPRCGPGACSHTRGVVVSAAAVIVATDWAWGEGKALAIASPVLLALAGTGAAQLLVPRRSVHGSTARAAVVLGALVIGVGWSLRARLPGDDPDAA